MRMDWVTYSLAQWSALANGNLITLLNTESWRDVRSEVLVSLLVSGVFGDEVEVFSADDEGSVHLGRDDGSGQDTATDGDEAGEGALLVCDESTSVSSSSTSLQFRNFISPLDIPDGLSHLVILIPLEQQQKYNPPRAKHLEYPKNPHTNVGAFNGGLWRSEAQTNVLVPSPSVLAGFARLGLRLGVEEDVRLLLESTLRLHSEFGGHGCGCGGCRGSQVCLGRMKS